VKKSVLLLFWGIAVFLHGLTGVAQTIPEGKFLLFNGVDQYLAIMNHPDFNIAAGESFTMSLRMRPDDFTDFYSLISKGNRLEPGGRYELSTYRSTNTPNIGLSVINSENTSLGAAYFQTIPEKTWVHVAWVYNAADKSSKVYVNGNLMNTMANSAIGRQPVQNSNELTVGCSWTNALEPELSNFWPGQIDELRFWKRALSAEDILADRLAAKAAITGLVAAYDFENINNAIVPDISGRGHTGQLNGYGIKVYRTLLPVGMGSLNERLMAFRMIGEPQSDYITNVTLDLTGTDAVSDISALKIYCNGSSERLNLATASLFASAIPTKNKITLTGNFKPAPGDNYFWVTADISSYAREGNKLRVSVQNYTTLNRSVVPIPSVEGSRTILLTSKLLFSAGDDGAEHYRIPALLTAKDGSLITATDKRWKTLHDLPNHIDLVIRRSTDNGETWSNALTIAGAESAIGFGDPALVLNHKTGEIVCLFAADKGFFSSSSSSPILLYQSKSKDNGITWSSPQNITPQIYGPGSSNPVTQNWQGAFVSSGSAIQMRSGRLIAAISVREDITRAVSNFIIYSDDNAITWKVSPNRAAINGNEAKLVELENRRILMSIRSAGTRIFNLSKDRGWSWGVPYAQTSITDPSCNGDMIRYTSIVSGFKKNRMLHSIPFSTTRKNLSVLLSYDEGQNWPVRKTIYSGPSAYSSLSILKDGSIGMYYEVGEYEIYQMYFTRFSLNWLTDGADTWVGRSKGEINSTEDIAEVTGLQVYPNPAIGEVNVSGNFEYNSIIEIYDSKGMIVSKTSVDNPGSPIRISLQGLSSGIYFVKIGGEVRKLIVQ
jgi:hypothetical protein